MGHLQPASSICCLPRRVEVEDVKEVCKGTPWTVLLLGLPPMLVVEKVRGPKDETRGRRGR